MDSQMGNFSGVVWKCRPYERPARSVVIPSKFSPLLPYWRNCLEQSRESFDLKTNYHTLYHALGEDPHRSCIMCASLTTYSNEFSVASETILLLCTWTGETKEAHQWRRWLTPSYLQMFFVQMIKVFENTNSVVRCTVVWSDYMLLMSCSESVFCHTQASRKSV